METLPAERTDIMKGWLAIGLLLATFAGFACGPKEGGEKVDAAPPAECEMDEFDCGDGQQCIDYSLVCDEYEDCNTGNDEANCSSGCGAGSYACDDGQCIHAAFVCDLVENCADGSDEVGCP